MEDHYSNLHKLVSWWKQKKNKHLAVCLRQDVWMCACVQGILLCIDLCTDLHTYDFVSKHPSAAAVCAK